MDIIDSKRSIQRIAESSPNHPMAHRAPEITVASPSTGPGQGSLPDPAGPRNSAMTR